MIMKTNKTNSLIGNDLVKSMMKDRAIRTSITKDSFLYFFHFYYAHYVQYATADFQKEIIHHIEKSSLENFYVCAFRGSGKSTMVTTAYPIWAILGKQQKKFIMIFTQTRMQAKQHMMNIRSELEGNKLLLNDLGPFQEESDEWGSYSLVFKKHGARITVASSEQSIRGARHNQYRPDLFICDDVEDVQSTKTREGRNKTYNWLRSEVVPAGDKNTRLIIVGNLLHEDSLLMRIKGEVESNQASGIFKMYPLIDNNEKCIWKGKYPDAKAIEDEKKKVSNENAWQREYLLRIIPADDQVIYPEWIQYYDKLPESVSYADGFQETVMGVDLAISQKSSADYFTIVSAYVYEKDNILKIYILGNTVNKRCTFPEQVELIKHMALNHKNSLACIESVAYQESVVQQLKHLGLQRVKSVGVTVDKRSRLQATTAAVQNGQILFPREGADDLIQQLVGFGTEKHDDLVDAFTLCINHILETYLNKPFIGIA